MSEPTEEPASSTEPSLLDKSKAEYSKAKTLVDDVVNQWEWVKQLNDFAAGAVPVRQYVTTYREAAWKAAASVRVRFRSALFPASRRASCTG